MPESSTASVAHTDTAIELTQTGVILKPGNFFETIGKTVLKLPDPAILHQLATSPPLQAIEAMQRLVELVVKLRSPDGGCPGDLEPTPANLAPYLVEETQEVLEALHAQIPSAEPSPPAPPFLAIADLIPQLLWSLAHSSYQVMQLIEGVGVSSERADQSWQGMLRLVTLLEVETPDRLWAIDLVTHQPSSPNSVADTSVQIHWNEATTTAHSVVSTHQLLEDLTRSLSNVSPLVRGLLAGLEVGLLEPEQGWRLGQLRLKLSFELMVDRVDEVVEVAFDVAATLPNFSTNVDRPTLAEFASQIELNELQTSLNWHDSGLTLADFTRDIVVAIAPTLEKEPSSPAIGVISVEIPQRLRDSGWEAEISQTIEVASVEIPPMGMDLFEHWELAHTTEAIATTGMIDETGVSAQPNSDAVIVLRWVDPAWRSLQAAQVTQQRLIEALKPHGTVPLDEVPFWLVEQAWTVGEQLASQIERSPERLLQAWLPEVFWQLTHVSYEVMQLVGGVTARVLQPHWDWQWGTLRLLPLLRIQTATWEWTLDVATGRPWQSHALLLDPTAIVCFTQFDRGTQSTLAEVLFSHAIEQIQTKAADIQQLMDGIWIEVCLTDESWQTAKLQLQFNLELMTE